MIFPRAKLYSFFVPLLIVFFPAAAFANSGLKHGKRPPQARIVGGIDAKIKYWPGQVALKLQNPDDAQSMFFCGGTAIAPNWVLTAAHCFDDLQHKGQKTVFARSGYWVGTAQGKVDASGWQLQILGGTDNLLKPKRSMIHDVEKVVLHPDYNPVTLFTRGNDIALVKLTHPIAKPYAVLSLDPAAAYPEGEVAQVAGFGLLKDNTLLDAFRRSDNSQFYAGSDRLQQVRVPVISRDVCQAANGSTGSVKDGQMCAGLKKGGKDSCQADSGGPLVLLSPERYPYQVGLVSWGNGCAKRKAYGVYTYLSHYILLLL